MLKKKIRTAALVAAVATCVAVPAQAAVSTFSPVAAHVAGAPAGANLTVHNGNLHIVDDGAVIDGLDIRGKVVIKANNVTIRNSVITTEAAPIIGNPGKAEFVAAIDAGRGTTGVRFENLTIVGKNPNYNIVGIRGSGFTVENSDISNVVDGVVVLGSDVTVRNSHIHDMYHGWSPTQKVDLVTHDDNIEISAGSNILIEGNKLTGAFTSAVLINQNEGKVSDVRVHANVLQVGGSAINVDEKGEGTIAGLSFTQNTFLPNATNSAVALMIPTTTSPTMADNYWAGAAPEVHRPLQP